MKNLDRLGRVAVFAGMPGKALEEVMRVMLVQHLTEGEVMYLSGKEPHVFVVLSGSVLWQRINAMRKVVIDVFGLGGVFAVGTKAGPDKYQDGFVEAMQPSELGAIERQRFFSLLHDYPAIALRLVEDLGKRLENVELKIKELSMPSVSDRLVVELRRLAQGKAGAGGEWYELGQKFTHERLANMVGVSRESVTRNLGALKRRGIVDYDHGYYRVKKSAADRLIGP